MSILDLETLQRMTGYKNTADIALCLTRQGIKYALGKRGRIWTTTTAVDAALGIDYETPRHEEEITLADMT
jgi:hypothetical protein